MGLAMIADDEKNTVRRNELMNELVIKHKDKAPKSIEICGIFLETLFAPEGRGRPLDIAAVEKVVASIPDDGRSNAEFFVGWFLKNHGDPTGSKKYLQRAADSPQIFNWYYFLAKDALTRVDGK